MANVNYTPSVALERNRFWLAAGRVHFGAGSGAVDAQSPNCSTSTKMGRIRFSDLQGDRRCHAIRQAKEAPRPLITRFVKRCSSSRRVAFTREAPGSFRIRRLPQELRARPSRSNKLSPPRETLRLRGVWRRQESPKRNRTARRGSPNSYPLKTRCIGLPSRRTGEVMPAGRGSNERWAWSDA